MGENDDRGCRVDAPEVGDGLLGPRGDHLLGIRETVGGGKPSPWIDHVWAPSGGARKPAQRGGDIDGSEHEQPRRRTDHVDEQSVPPLGGLGPQQLGAHASRLVVELGRPERSSRRTVGENQELRARNGAFQNRHLGRAPAAAGELLKAARLVRLDPYVDFAAAGQSHVPRVRVGDPEVHQLRRIAPQDAVGDLGHGALDAAAGHRAGDLPVLVDGHLGARRTRRRALHVDHGCERDPVAALPPCTNLRQNLLHTNSDLLKDDS